MTDPDPIARDLRALLTRTIEQLEALGIGDEAIATLLPARRIALIRRPAVMEPVGRAWRLGVLLLGRDGRLFGTGRITRAVEPKHETVYINEESRKRRELRQAATRGDFMPGDVVNFDVAEIPLDADSLRTGSGPLSLRGDTVMVRWNAGQGDEGLSSLESYLAARLGILRGD
jgi:hypothetical protein